MATNNAINLSQAGVTYYNGTGTFTGTTSSVAGQVLLGSGATLTAPTFIAPTAGSGLSITTNATTLQYALITPVVVSSGGTGNTTLTAHTVLVGEGTAAIAQIGPG